MGQQTGGLDRNDPYRQVVESGPSSAAESKPKKGMARVIRDEDGKVVDIVEYESEDDELMTPWGKELNHESESPDLKLIVPRLNEGKEGETVKGMQFLTYVQQFLKKLPARASRFRDSLLWLSMNGSFSSSRLTDLTIKRWLLTGNEMSGRKRQGKSDERKFQLSHSRIRKAGLSDS